MHQCKDVPPKASFGKTTPCICASVPSILRHHQADHTSAKSWCLVVSFKWRCRRCSQRLKEQQSLHHLAVSSAQRDASHVQTLRPEFVAVGNLFTFSTNSTAIAPPLDSTEQSCSNTRTHTHCIAALLLEHPGAICHCAHFCSLSLTHRIRPKIF